MTQAAVTEDIRFLLDANALGVSGTDLFSYEWGSSIDGKEIDKQVLVVDSDSITSDLKETYEQPTFIIYTRGNPGESAKVVHDKARPIFDFLRAQPTQAINGVDYLEFEPIGGLLPLGRDDNKRFVYSMNFYTFRDPI